MGTEYGSTTIVQAASGTAYSLPLSGQVTYLTYPAGDTLTVGPTEPYGTDVASAAAGATATASSGNASAAIGGLAVGYGLGWSSANGDTTPSLTVALSGTPTIDRVVVDTQSVGSTASGVRNYTVSADEPGTGWTTLATETGQYRNHVLQFTFPPVAATALRIDVSEVNFGGYYGGGIPPFWAPNQAAPAFLHAVQAYAGTGGPSVVDGTGLTPLLGGSSSGGTGGGTTTTTTQPSSTTTSPTGPSTTTTQPSTTTTTAAGRPGRRLPHDDLGRSGVRVRRGLVLRSQRRPRPEPAGRGLGLHAGRQRLLAGRGRRRDLQLRDGPVLRLDRRLGPERPDRRHGRQPGRRRVLAGGWRRWHLRHRGRALPRLAPGRWSSTGRWSG